MTSKDLITTVAGKTNLSKKRISELLQATTETMVEELLTGKSVAVHNFGMLEVKEKKGRLIVLPKSGIRTMTQPKTQIAFKMSANFKELLNKQ